MSRKKRTSLKKKNSIREKRIWGILYSISPPIQDLEISKPRITIGRAKVCAITLNDDLISKFHCQINYSKVKTPKGEKPKAGYSIWLIDKSTNGVWVNGQLIGTNKKVQLFHCDEISFLSPKLHGKPSPKYRFIFHDTLFPFFGPKDIGKEYKIISPVLEGGYGSVYLAKENNQKDFVVIKKIDNNCFYDAKQLDHEKNKLKFQESLKKIEKIDHNNLIKLKKVINTEENIYLVFNYLNNGDLTNRILEKGKYSESEARILFKNLIETIDYLHKNETFIGVLTPEIILMANQDSDTDICLSDIGITHLIQPAKRNGYLKIVTNTRPPESIEGKEIYNKTVDIWSLGVILYFILSGDQPFKEPRIDGLSLYKQINKVKFSFDPKEFSNISIAAKNLIRRMLHIIPESRPTASQILKHPWVIGKPNLIKYECEDLEEFLY
ncbi:serine/threonine-protein kinase dclk3 [Anaeramoeba flamelloides]|uniref:Serine/threonine-protein kinase dclk3 n=1 Tax=Anaeramoeba flamelloides TaxID=1746091 RepID=A0AAV8AKD8_9EUKA|nr:serine/threonine-protein kinase dclk3 [Anaeramoeba flamelloides]